MIFRFRPMRLLMALTAGLVAVGLMLGASAPPVAVRGQTDVTLKVLGSAPLRWDPQAAGDTSSATMLAQVFEGLTTLDPSNNVEPALAESWTVADDGRHVDFKLRPGLSYSDGSAIQAQDVVDSWFRLIDPQRPGPLVSLMADVSGVTDYLAGRVGREAVGLHAQADHVLVDLAHPASYFVAVTTSPSLAVVPPSMFGSFGASGGDLPPHIVVSGAYRPTSMTDTDIRLEANPHYWAGTPPLSVVDVVTDTGGASPVDLFEADDIDYTPVGSLDAAWLRFEANLGPQLRQTNELAVQYYGFDTRTAPFSDPLVRQAFAKAVNWDRIVTLGSGKPALSLVPAGMPGADTTDYRPTYDPNAARDLLTQAGFAGGNGFPPVSLISNGFGYEPQVAAELKQQLGITVTVEVLDFPDILARQQSGEHAQFWNEIWSADYPHPNDFLGLLLQTGSASNEGGWSNADYDSEIAAAASATDPADQAAHYAVAQGIMRDQAPVIPVDVIEGWALSRDGLLGAIPTGAGYLRFAGMTWATGE